MTNTFTVLFLLFLSLLFFLELFGSAVGEIVDSYSDFKLEDLSSVNHKR